MPESEERRTEGAFQALLEVVSSRAKPGELAGRSNQLIQLAQSATNGSGRNFRRRLKRAREKGPEEFAHKLNEVVGEITYERRQADFRRATETHSRLKNTVGLWLEGCSREEFFQERRQTVLDVAGTAEGLPGADGLIHQLEHASDSHAFVKSVRELQDQLWEIMSVGVPPKTSFRTSHPQQASLSA